MKQQQRTTPLYGCILIGGKSSRMGQPKHLIEYAGKSWLAIIAQKLNTFCDGLILAGKGEVPDGNWHRVNDVHTCKGPLAGILAAFKSRPDVNFIVCSCDIPLLTESAIQWLLEQKKEDIWAILPKTDTGFVEPLFALYDHKILPYLDELAANKEYRLSHISDHPKALVVTLPHKYHLSLKNCNFAHEIP